MQIPLAGMIWRGPARRSPDDDYNHHDSILLNGNQVFGLQDHILVSTAAHQVFAQIQDLYEDGQGQKRVVYSAFNTIPDILPRDANAERQELFLIKPKTFGLCLVQDILPYCTLLRVEYRFALGRSFISPLTIDGNTPLLNSLTLKYFVERTFDTRSRQAADLDETEFCQQHSETCTRDSCVVPNCLQYKVLARIEHAISCESAAACGLADCRLDKEFVRNAMQCMCGGQCKTCTAFNKFLRFHEQQCFRSARHRGQCKFPRCRNSARMEIEKLGGWSIVNPRLLLLNKSSRVGEEFQVNALPHCEKKSNTPLPRGNDVVIWAVRKGIDMSLPNATKLQCVVDRLAPVSTAQGRMAWVKIVDPKPGMEDMDVIPHDAAKCKNADKYRLTIQKSSLLLMDRCKEAVLLAYHVCNEREKQGLPKLEKPHPALERARQLNMPFPFPSCNTIDLFRSTQELYLVSSNNTSELNFAYKSRIRQYAQMTSKFAQTFNLTSKEVNDWIYTCPTNQGVARFADLLKLKCTICKCHTTELRACSMFALCEQILCENCINLVASATIPANPDFEEHQPWFCPSCSVAALSAKTKHSKIDSMLVPQQRKPAKRSSVATTTTTPSNIIDIFRHYEQGDITAEDSMAQIRAMMVANAQKTMKIWDNNK